MSEVQRHSVDVDEDDFTRHLDYFHYNPVELGLAPSPNDRPYSYFGRLLRLGAYFLDSGSKSAEPVI